MYCVRCGDKIDKNELICDKCGLRFSVVRADGTTVYINQSPTPVNVQKKKKKFRFGWLIALVSVISVTAALLFGGILLGSGILVGILVFYEKPTPGTQVVVSNPDNNGNLSSGSNSSSSGSSNGQTVTYQNTGQNDTNQYVNNAIREPFVKLKGDGSDTVTVMVYMNGSDLESEYGYATEDLREMLNATLSDNVNVVVQTGGTKKWKTDGISNKQSQRFLVTDKHLELIDDSLGQLDITREDTLEGFIKFCADNYPADRNILILWDHGGGVVYGYGVDENLNDPYAALTIDEIQRAVKASGIKFEMIGFDACLMGGLETACALCDVSDYLVVSEDFESGSGWEYQNWLSLLGYNSSTPMTDVAKTIIKDFIQESIFADSEGILALIDLRYSRLLYTAWTEFAYANEDELLTYDYTMSMERSDRAPDNIFDRYGRRDIWDWLLNDSYSMETYCYAVDIMALASTMNTDESNALESVMKSAVLYCSSTSGDSYMTGLSVTLPYGDSDFYDELNGVFSKTGFDSKYLSFLGKFADTEGISSYDWGSSGFDGWDYYDSSSDYDDYDWSDFDWNSYFDTDYGFDEDYYYDDYYRDYDFNSFYDSFDDSYYDESYYNSDYDDYYFFDDFYYDPNSDYLY